MHATCIYIHTSQLCEKRDRRWQADRYDALVVLHDFLAWLADLDSLKPIANACTADSSLIVDNPLSDERLPPSPPGIASFLTNTSDTQAAIKPHFAERLCFCQHVWTSYFRGSRCIARIVVFAQAI